MSLTINSSPYSLSTPSAQVKAQKDSPTSDQLVYDNLNSSKAGNQAIQKTKMTTGCQPRHSLISLAKEATNIFFISQLGQPTLLHIPPTTNSSFTPPHSLLLPTCPLPPAETLPQALPTLPPSHFVPLPGGRGHLGIQSPCPALRAVSQSACCSLTPCQLPPAPSLRRV